MFGPPGLLWTPFELKTDLPASNIQPDAATLTLHALNLLKRRKTSKYVFPLSQKRKLLQIWGAVRTFQLVADRYYGHEDLQAREYSIIGR